MTEELFEALEQSLRVAPSGEYENGVNAGLTRMRQALREMIVGEPIAAKVHHCLTRSLPREKRTEYLFEYGQRHYCHFKPPGHHGTDGQKVMVMVLDMEGPRKVNEELRYCLARH